MESKTPNECVKQEKDSQTEHTSGFKRCMQEAGTGKMQAEDQRAQTTMCNPTGYENILHSIRQHGHCFVITVSIIYKNTETLCYKPETNILSQLHFQKKTQNPHKNQPKEASNDQSWNNLNDKIKYSLQNK